jgi:hypothetical protein
MHRRIRFFWNPQNGKIISSFMEKSKHHLLREAILEKILTDSDIHRLRKKFDVEFNEASLQLIFSDEDPILGFLAKTEFSKEISIFCIAEHGYDHQWLAEDGSFIEWNERDNALHRAQSAFARKRTIQDGGISCIRPESSAASLEQSKLIEFIKGRKESANAVFEFISSRDISTFFERIFNPESSERVTHEEIESRNSKFSKALKLIIPEWQKDWRARFDKGQKENWEGIGIQELIRKYWHLGLKNSPVLPIGEILFFFPKLWSIVKESVEIKNVYKALNGCLGLDDFYLLRNYVDIGELYGLPCFSWFPEIIEAEQDSICWADFSRNENVEWTETIIRTWADKIDFQNLSSNRSVRWTKDLIRDYEGEWNWEKLCQNESVPWNADLIKCFEERIAWPQLSGNKSLPWTGELLDEFSFKWIWKKQKTDHAYFTGNWHKGNWHETVSHSASDHWGALNISSNSGIEWTPDLLTKYESQLDVWALAAKGKLDTSCVRCLFDKLHEHRPAFKYRAKFSDWSDDIYRVSLTGWHLLFLNEHASIDASVLNDIHSMQFTRTPDMAIRSQSWDSEKRTSNVLELLFPKRYEDGIRLKFDVNLADCVENANTWGSVLMKYAIRGDTMIFGNENIERQFAPLLLDIRAQLNTRRHELFDFKIKVWEQQRELLKDELALKEIWRDLMSHVDFGEALQYLRQRDADLSVAEIWLSLFVITCRYRMTIGFCGNYYFLIDFQDLGITFFRRDIFKPYEDVAHELKSIIQSGNNSTEYSLHHENRCALCKLTAHKIFREYFQRWQTHDRIDPRRDEYRTISEAVLLPTKLDLDELLGSTLKSLGLSLKEDFGISAHHFSYEFLWKFPRRRDK